MLDLFIIYNLLFIIIYNIYNFLNTYSVSNLLNLHIDEGKVHLIFLLLFKSLFY